MIGALILLFVMALGIVLGWMLVATVAFKVIAVVTKALLGREMSFKGGVRPTVIAQNLVLGGVLFVAFSNLTAPLMYGTTFREALAYWWITSLAVAGVRWGAERGMPGARSGAKAGSGDATHSDIAKTTLASGVGNHTLNSPMPDSMKEKTGSSASEVAQNLLLTVALIVLFIFLALAISRL